MRVGLVNGRGREDTCSIIRPDKEGQAEGGIEGGWEDGRMMEHSVCQCFSFSSLPSSYS